MPALPQPAAPPAEPLAPLVAALLGGCLLPVLVLGGALLALLQAVGFGMLPVFSAVLLLGTDWLPLIVAVLALVVLVLAELGALIGFALGRLLSGPKEPG